MSYISLLIRDHAAWEMDVIHWPDCVCQYDFNYDLAPWSLVIQNTPVQAARYQRKLFLNLKAHLLPLYMAK